MRIKHLAWLLLLTFYCCKPHSSPVTPDPDFTFKYNARYDSVISMPANTEYNFIFFIDVLNGDISNNRLGCTIGGCPGNMTVSPSFMSVGQIRGGVFTFSVGDVPLGVDTLKFTISSAQTGVTTHKLILKIIPPPDHAPDLVGTYDSSFDVCAAGIYKHPSVVTTDTAYGITISNLNNLGAMFIVKAKVSDVIRIPLQTFGSKTIYGSGTYNKDPLNNTVYEMTINDTIITGLDSQHCVVHIQHK